MDPYVRFLISAGLILLVFFANGSNLVSTSDVNILKSDGSQSYITSKEYRTSYHFQPPRNWINDPNGPMYYNGIYHLFYQYNPKAAVWESDIHWGHSVSTDLINWVAVDIAIAPSMPFDINGCWSGSVTILPGNMPVILYTGIDKDNQQVQNIAVPKNMSDPFLREWVKPNTNPLMAPISNIDPSLFRDPTTGWLGNDGYWRVIVGALIGDLGTTILFRSKDFIHWTRAWNPLHSSRGTGMWECLDFFPVSFNGTEGLDTSVSTGAIKHVLKISLFNMKTDHYMLGRYIEQEDVFVPDDVQDDYRKWLRYDYGNFYASKSFYDAEKKRRIVWAWSNESDSSADDVAKGWSGIQAVPRTIWLDKTKRQLLQWPVKELESLRRNELHVQDRALNMGDLFEIPGLHTSQADVEVEFEITNLEKAEPFDANYILDPQMLCSQMDASVQGGLGPFGLMVLASKNLEEHTAIFFRIFKSDKRYVVLICSDQRRSSLRQELYKPTYGGFLDIDIKRTKKISLRTLIDHSVVESFGGGGRTCITARVYPDLLFTGKPHAYAFNNGSQTVRILELKAWEMSTPCINIDEKKLISEPLTIEGKPLFRM